MPRMATAPPHARVFGRVRSFDCECPACGAVIVARGTREGRPRELKLRQRQRQTRRPYNAVTAVMRCPGCRAQFMVGLIIWPLARGGGAQPGEEVIPLDMRPNAHQRAILRQYVYGFAAEQAKRKGDEVNVAVTAECTCGGKGKWKPSCPEHGDPAQMQSTAADQRSVDDARQEQQQEQQTDRWNDGGLMDGSVYGRPDEPNDD